SLFLLLCVCAIGTATYAQGKRYPIGNSTNLLNDFRRQLATPRKSNGVSSLQLKISSALTLPAAISYRSSSGTGREQLIGTLENNPNSSVYLLIDNKSVHGHILLNNKTAYEYSSDSTGAVSVQETDINKVVCINFQKAVQPASPASTTTTDAAAN